MSVFILDASVATRMFLAVPERLRALAAARAYEFIAPRLILTETANALWKYVRRGDITLDQAQEAVRQLDRQLSIVDDFRLIVLAQRLAAELDHPVYDCVYLATAQSYQYPLLTADKRLIAFARDLSLDVADLASIPIEG
ncbi:type II toxin-antitoxin system VapC family toxin [Maricaulis salignorans]|uniref:Ribonuclease VapC n=1 Tax=Maricaulis salignorans TaxID=144026 RepID=A0A1G9P4V0_9PROT|nr:type II toxin-antitoxin system VapC family toxin [Maricaulis salignorans]SDL93215.1 Predicted nucleic acid-binding protein, contains PIN domain [Maricaulis salignorans]